MPYWLINWDVFFHRKEAAQGCNEKIYEKAHGGTAPTGKSTDEDSKIEKLELFGELFWHALLKEIKV